MKERKSNRLKDYDYSQNGYYFVTVCTKDRREVFGNVVEGRMVLNRYGKIVDQCWHDLRKHYLNCSLDSFGIMPNHIHGIIVIDNENTVGNGLKPFPAHGLSEIMRGFKTFSSRKINAAGNGLKPFPTTTAKNSNSFQWQKSFYDHIIRDEESLNRIRQYITYNPLKWELDIENKDNHSRHKNSADYYDEIITGVEKTQRAGEAKT
jgi:REP element-mobilizing transposase RayT